MKLQLAYMMPVLIAAAGSLLAANPAAGTEEALIAAPETALVFEQCTVCHGPAQILKQGQKPDAAWWDQTLTDMVEQHGAEFTAEDRATIFGYLVRHYSRTPELAPTT